MHTLNNALLFSESIQEELIKSEGKSCYRNHYGRYATLELAKSACLNASECVGVYDMFCNGPPFYLCPREKKLKISKSSCTYIKGIFGLMSVWYLYIEMFALQIIITHFFWYGTYYINVLKNLKYLRNVSSNIPFSNIHLHILLV